MGDWFYWQDNIYNVCLIHFKYEWRNVFKKNQCYKKLASQLLIKPIWEYALWLSLGMSMDIPHCY